MALKPNRPRVWLSRLHLLIRLIGLTGLVAVAGAAVLAQVQGMFGTDETFPMFGADGTIDVAGFEPHGRCEGEADRS